MLEPANKEKTQEGFRMSGAPKLENCHFTREIRHYSVFYQGNLLNPGLATEHIGDRGTSLLYFSFFSTYMRNKIYQNLKFHFMFPSIPSINIYFEYEWHPEAVGPIPFCQKYRAAILLGKV